MSFTLDQGVDIHVLLFPLGNRDIPGTVDSGISVHLSY